MIPHLSDASIVFAERKLAVSRSSNAGACHPKQRDFQWTKRTDINALRALMLALAHICQPASMLWPSQENPMTQQRSEYPLDYTQGPTHHDPSQAAPEAAPGATKDRFKDAAVRTQKYAEKISEQLGEYGEKAQDAARNFQPFVRNSMKERPIATLAVASFIGFALGALWKK